MHIFPVSYEGRYVAECSIRYFPEDILRSERDSTLDSLKGIACVLMLIAHFEFGRVSSSASPFTEMMLLVGSFAPALFYAVTGVTSTYQAGKYPLASIVTAYAFMALLGLSYNASLHADLWRNLQMDILQIIAVGGILVAALHRRMVLKPMICIAISLAAFAIHALVQPLVPEFPLRQLVFTPGTFSFFPWIAVFFLGIAAHRMAGRTGAIVCASCVIGLTIAHSVGIDLDIHGKWTMSAGYFVLLSAVVFGCFSLARVSAPSVAENKLILYLGRRSLQFLYLHFAVVILTNKVLVARLGTISVISALLLWILALATTLASIWVLERLNRPIERLFRNWFSWGLLLLLICAVPTAFQQPKVVNAAESALGIAFAANYHTLFGMVRRLYQTSPA